MPVLAFIQILVQTEWMRRGWKFGSWRIGRAGTRRTRHAPAQTRLPVVHDRLRVDMGSGHLINAAAPVRSISQHITLLVASDPALERAEDRHGHMQEVIWKLKGNLSCALVIKSERCGARTDGNAPVSIRSG
jgi:hypothetical protein